MLTKVLRTSAFRLTLLYAGIFCASFVVLFAVIYWSTARYMDRQFDDTVGNEIAEIQSDAASRNLASLQEIVSELTLNSPGFFYLLQDPGGDVLAGNLPAMTPSDGITDRMQVRIQDRTISLRGKGVHLNGGVFLFVGLSTIELHKMQSAVARVFVWGFVAMIFISLFSGAFISLAMLSRIEGLSNVSREIVNGDLDRRIPLRGSNDEFDHLAVSLNVMLDRIQGLMDGLRQISTDIAHDLRTPLTRLRQRIEMALRKADDADSLRIAFHATLKDLDSILDTFSALLRIAQLETSERRAHFTDIDLTDLLRTAVELYAPMAEEKAQSIVEKIDDGLTIRGDRELLLQLFANVLENAVRHSPQQALIEIGGQRLMDETVVVSVRDNGPGIPEDMRSKVFQRFFRLEPSRTTPGSGLGLSLVKAIASLHNISVELLSNEPGLVVQVRFG
ncbi:MAG TPA: ATP-binding protein [Stellaceae bacterium]|jgi:signal transduction histidine kinase|nr:ATP-binding protein [Stellaceae bacterium]